MPDVTLVRGQPTAVGRLAEDYLAHRRAARLSPKTIRHAYGYPLRSVFVPRCADHEIEKARRLTPTWL